MKKFSKRLLTMLLSAAMVFGLSGMTAFAAETNEQDAQALSSQEEVTTLAADDKYQEYDLDFSWYTNPDAESYTITTPEQLAAFSAIVNGTAEGVRQNSFTNQTVNLGGDIVMNSADDVQSEDGEWGGIATPTLTISDDAYAFTPIGNMRFNLDGSWAGGYSFQGTFNGNGYRIENLFVVGDDGYLGLFGVVGGDKDREDDVGLLENFTVSGVIECDGGSDGSEMDFVGGACAKLNAGATIRYVTNEATIYGPYTDNLGGIVGFAGTPSAMGGSDNITTNPSYEDNPSGYNTFVLCCANEGTVLGFHKNGGIVGENAATVKYCYNSGWILCRRNFQQVRTGGICGSNGNNGAPVEESVIAYCYNMGPISNNGRDDQYVASASGVRAYAGITGANYGGLGKNEVYNCYNMGAIPQGYADYNSIASRLDASDSYGYGAYVAVRNNYSLDTDEIARNSASDYPQETGYWVTEENFKKTTYGDEDILTGLGPYFVADLEGDASINGGFPILWWQDAEATLPTLTGITIAQGPDKTDYINGDIFDPTGMVVYAEYDNGARALLTSNVATWKSYTYNEMTGGYSCDKTPLTGEPQYVEITYTDGDVTVSAWQPINGAKPSISEVNITSDIADNAKTYDGEGVTLTADAQVDPAGAELSYQWYKENESGAFEPIGGATDKEFTLEGNVSDSGTYQCVVTASYDGEQTDPASGEITIEIKQAEQELSFAEPEVTKMLGDEPFTNELSGMADGATVTYKSSDDTIASVDADGQVTIHAVGKVTITADVSETSNYKEATATYELTVEEPQAPTIVDVTITSGMEGNTKTYDGEGVTLTVSAEVDPANAELTYQWYTVAEDGTETRIDGATDSVLDLAGDVSDTGTYKCEVTATTVADYGSAFGEAAITITIAKAAQEISFEQTALTKTVDDEPFANTLIETTVDTAGGATISYNSSDETIATVDENGQVTILDAGDVTITATVSGTANYTEAAASYALTIEAAQEPEVVDKSVLEAAIADAEGLTASKYTEESWSALKEALAAAKLVDADDNATESDVKQAEIDLINAIAGLKGVGDESGTETDKSDLMEEYVKALDLSESDYTPESWEPFANALEEALEILLDPDATQEDVEAAEEALLTAMDNLEKKSDTSGTGGNVKNGLCQIEKGVRWGYYVNDVVDASFTGFVHNDNGDWYVQNGYVVFADSSANGVFKDKTGEIGEKGTWYYVVRGKVQHDFTGLANYKNENGWWYIVKGEVDFSHNGVDKNVNGWWYVTGGKVQFGFTGLANYRNENGWWYISGGKVNFNANTVAKNKNGWWYVTGGKVQFGFTGLANYKNSNGWWYINAGKVTFDYTGIASNKNGTWYIVDSKVRFDYSGVVTYHGLTYTVRGGKVN